MEIVLLATGEKPALRVRLDEFLPALNSNPLFQILPITCDVALEFASLAILCDPADRLIAATARVHRLTLVTSDQRIIDSDLVSVIE